MALFKITIKKDVDGIHGSPNLPKGATFQVVSRSSSEPTQKEMAAAIQRLFGIEVNEGRLTTGFFGKFANIKVEKI